MTNLEQIKAFCDIMKNVNCEVCEDCGTGAIVINSDEYDLEVMTQVRAKHFHEDIENAIQEAIDTIHFYEEVRLKLELLRLLRLEEE
jgi:hypothetical protein